MTLIYYDGIRVYQRSENSPIALFCAAATAKSILSWAKISRTLETPGAAQRTLSKTHVRQIRNYLSAYGSNTIPTTVTIALPDKFEFHPIPGSSHSGEPTEGETWMARVSIARLSIDADPNDKPGTIIDGQHRLTALEGYEDSDIPIFVSIILGADTLECALQFVVVNNSAKRVPADLVKAIVAELPPKQREEFDSRLQAVGITLGKYSEALRVLSNNSGSPFKGLVDWDANREGDSVVKPLALEESLKVILNGLQAGSKMELDDAVQLLMAIWNGVLLAWDEPDVEWTDSRLSGKACLVAVTEFVVERLNLKAEEVEFDLTSPEEVQDIARELFSKVPAAFWLADWNQKGLDTSAGRDLIRLAISEVRKAVTQKHSNPLAHVKSLNLTPDTSNRFSS